MSLTTEKEETLRQLVETNLGAKQGTLNLRIGEVIPLGEDRLMVTAFCLFESNMTIVDTDEILVVLKGDSLEWWGSSSMEPEDAMFSRDMGWVPEAIAYYYEIGRKDGKSR